VGPAALSPLLRHIAQGSGTTRAHLARVTGLSRSSVSQRVDALLGTGLVIEDGTTPSGGGRPALRLRINAEAGLIVTADLGATRARFAVSDLAGAELASSIKELAIDQEPEQVLGLADKELRILLDTAGRQAADVRAIVVGLPGPVEIASGTAVKPPLMPRWDGYRVPGYFAERYAADTLVDNDVNLMALGEHRAIYPDLKHLLFIKVGSGIGCGIIVSGQLHRGADGAAGDLGHIRVPGCDTPCRCGNTGCLEAVAGGQALAKHLAAKGIATVTARDVARLAAEGDTQARQAVRAAAQHIGEVLAAIVSFANPSAIVVGGSLARLDEVLLSGIRSGIYGRALPLAQRSLRIETSTLNERAGTAGAIALAQEHVLSEKGLANLLRIRRPVYRHPPDEGAASG
jgi:predicted NBD/HSP70 family sugar kinase